MALAHTVADTLTMSNARRELPKILHEVFAPTTWATQEACLRYHFAPEAQLSHPCGLAHGASEITSLCALLAWIRRWDVCKRAAPGAAAAATRAAAPVRTAARCQPTPLPPAACWDHTGRHTKSS